MPSGVLLICPNLYFSGFGLVICSSRRIARFNAIYDCNLHHMKHDELFLFLRTIIDNKELQIKSSYTYQKQIDSNKGYVNWFSYSEIKRM